MRKLTVIIPAKNEEDNLRELLPRLAEVEVSGFGIGVLVIDDGSTDGTSEVAELHGAKVVSHSENRGLGAALRTGLREAVLDGAEVVAYMDADLEYFPEDIPKVVEPVICGRADYVMGSRFSGGRVRGMRLHRKVGNVVFTGLMRSLTGLRIRDGQTGMRAFSREAARAAEIVHDYNYAQVLTLDLLGKDFRLEEVPIEYQIRSRGSSFVDWRYPFKVVPAIIRQIGRRESRHPSFRETTSERVGSSSP